MSYRKFEIISLTIKSAHTELWALFLNKRPRFTTQSYTKTIGKSRF